MITLTAPNDVIVKIDPKMIVSMYPNDGVFHHAAKTVIIVGGQHQAVKETIDEIEKIIAAE